MADYTLTRYLKLKIADDLSSDAKYNLLRLDTLGSTFINDVNETLNIRSATDITIEPESPAVGGSNAGGTVTIGTPSHYVNVLANSLSFTLRSPLSLPAGTNTYLSLSAQSSLSNDALTLGASGSKTLVATESGDVVVKDAAQTLTNKSLSGLVNTFTNIPNSATTATSSNTASTIVARDGGGNFAAGTITASLSGNATSATTAANLSGSNLTGDVSNSGNTIIVNVVGGKTSTEIALATTAALAATDVNTPSTIVRRDAAGNFVAGTISASTLNATSVVASSLIGTLAASNLTGTVAIANGGTGATTASGARASLGVTAANILPSYTGNALATLRLNSSATDVEWVLGAGQGTVTGVTASSPLSVTGNPSVDPNISLPQATSLASGYLTSADWSTFNSKEPAISSGTTGQYWRGDKSWQTLDKSAVGLSNVDNTSDVNKPISSAVQTALNAKYDASNPASYVDAAGAKSAAVVNSTAGSQTDQAPSVSAVKSYVSAFGGGAAAYTWSTADGATKSITHSLNKNTVSVTIYDENGEDVLVDVVDRTSLNAVSLTSSVPPTGNWTVVIRY